MASILDQVTAKIDADTAGMTPDERFHFWRQQDIARRADAARALAAAAKAAGYVGKSYPLDPLS